MRKPLIALLAILFVAVQAHAQWFNVNNLTGTTKAYGTYSVTVTSSGIVSMGGSPPCVGVTQYWEDAGSGTGQYTFTLNKPVWGVRVNCFGMNGGPLGGGEYLEMFINGAPYTLTPADILSYTSCGFPTGGPCYLWTGFLMAPVGAIFDYNGGTIEIKSCFPITSFEVLGSGTLNGVSDSIDIDTVRSIFCIKAISNDPCIGDMLNLDMQGDSTGATYLWQGPGGFTSTIQDPSIFPTTFADSGMYYCYRTVGGVIDTDSVDVAIHPLPVVTATNNSPLCAGLIDTLQLTVNLFSPGETFLWTGPYSFTSTLQDPIIPGFLPVSVGTYTVVATTAFGCVASGTTNVSLVPPPAPPVITGIAAYCYGQPFVPFSVTGYSGLLEWYTVPTGGSASALAPTINTSAPGTYTVYVSQRIGSCESGRASFTVLVRPQIIPLFSWNATLGCSSDQVTFTNLSNADWYIWEFGDGSSSTDTFTTSHTFNSSSKTQTVLLRAFIPGCEQDTTAKIDLVHNVKALFSPTPDTICANQMTVIPVYANTVFQDNSYATEPNGPGGTPNLAGLAGIAGGPDNGTTKITNLVTYKWSFGDGTSDNVQSPVAHIYNTGGRYRVTLSVTDSIGCVDTTHEDVIVLEYHLQLTHDTMLCISQPLPLLNAITAVPRVVDGNVGFSGNKDYHKDDFTYSWTPADHLDDPSARVPYYTGQGITTYTDSVIEKQFGCYVIDTERINSVIGVVLQNVTTAATIYYGSSIQLNADSEVIYMWKPDDGSLSNANINNPVAKPTVTTMYTVYGYDHNGCLDSAYVHVTVDSTMTEDIPTGFTPNGDGLNDVFRPVGLKFQNMLEFRVYNRWGVQLFYSNNPKVGWDGTYNGVPQDLGVYYYSIIVGRPGGDGGDITYKGEVTLIR
jgi:gliding motility-associated-like protein